MPATQSMPAATDASHKASFFRQSGWLMIANIGGGILMWAVHLLARRTGPVEYGIYGAFLAVIMCVPTLPLQMVLTHQTAQATATGHEGELRGRFRLLLLLTTLVWLAGMIVMGILSGSIIESWHLTNSAALWITMPIVLLQMLQPLFWGVLQGQQNFLWLGWSMLTSGVGRLALATVAVLVMHGRATSMLMGVLVGLLAADLIAVWQTRKVWSGPSAPFDRRKLFAEVTPLLIGFAAFQFLFTADTMFSKSYFDEETMGFYVSAGTMSRALMWLVGPLATVMFPRLVHSAAKSEQSNLMGIVFGGTAILAVSGALGLSLLGLWVVNLIYGPAYVKVASTMLPWYAGAMVPLALANVLLSNLLAKSNFRIVPGLCVLAGAYAIALTQFHSEPVSVLKTLGVFNLFLLALCAWFTWFQKPGKRGGSPIPSGLSVLLLVAVLGYGIVRGQGQTNLFSESFKDKPGEGWSWIRENPATWRISEQGLQIRIEPGNMWGGQNNARNLLVRSLPATAQENIEVSVALENKPTNQYEQVDLVWYYDDSNMVKLGQELVDGKLCIVMGREEGDKTRTIAIVPLDPSSTRVEVRFLADKNQLRGDFRLVGATEWRLAGNCDMPAPANAKPRISLQCYQGPPDQEHWATITNFRINKAPKE